MIKAGAFETIFIGIGYGISIPPQPESSVPSTLQWRHRVSLTPRAYELPILGQGREVGRIPCPFHRLCNAGILCTGGNNRTSMTSIDQIEAHVAGSLVILPGFVLCITSPSSLAIKEEKAIPGCVVTRRQPTLHPREYEASHRCLVLKASTRVYNVERPLYHELDNLCSLPSIIIP